MPAGVTRRHFVRGAAGLVLPLSAHGALVNVAGGKASPEVPAGSVPAWLSNLGLANGQWAQIPNTALSSVTVSGAPSGRQNVIDAWNGGCGDQARSRYYMLACGGHGDYGGNEVYVFDLEQDNPAPVVARGVSSPLPQNVTHGSDGRPVSSHTYMQQVYCPIRDRAMRIGVGSRFSSGVDELTVDGFNPATNDWDPANTYPVITPTPGAEMSDFGAMIDPLTGNVYSTCDHSGTYTLRRLTFSTNLWTSMGSTGNGRAATGAWDTTRNRGIMRMNGGTIAVASSGSFSNISFSGGSPGQYSAFFYVPALDVFMWRTSAAGGAVSQSNAGTLATSSFATTGGGSIPSRANGAMNSFQYFPRLGGAMYIPSFSANVWWLQIHDPTI